MTPRRSYYQEHTFNAASASARDTVHSTTSSPRSASLVTDAGRNTKVEIRTQYGCVWEYSDVLEAHGYIWAFLDMLEARSDCTTKDVKDSTRLPRNGKAELRHPRPQPTGPSSDVQKECGIKLKMESHAVCDGQDAHDEEVYVGKNMASANSPVATNVSVCTELPTPNRSSCSANALSDAEELEDVEKEGQKCAGAQQYGSLLSDLIGVEVGNGGCVTFQFSNDQTVYRQVLDRISALEAQDKQHEENATAPQQNLTEDPVRDACRDDSNVGSCEARDNMHGEAADACDVLLQNVTELPIPLATGDAPSQLGQSTPHIEKDRCLQLGTDSEVLVVQDTCETMADLRSLEHLMEKGQHKHSDAGAFEVHNMSVAAARQNHEQKSALAAPAGYTNSGRCEERNSVRAEAADACRLRGCPTVDVEYSTTSLQSGRPMPDVKRDSEIELEIESSAIFAGDNTCEQQPSSEHLMGRDRATMGVLTDPHLEQLDTHKLSGIGGLESQDMTASAARQKLTQESVPAASPGRSKTGSCEERESFHSEAADACRLDCGTTVDVEHSTTSLRNGDVVLLAPTMAGDATSQHGQPTPDVEKSRCFQLGMEAGTGFMARDDSDTQSDLKKHQMQKDQPTEEARTDLNSGQLDRHKLSNDCALEAQKHPAPPAWTKESFLGTNTNENKSGVCQATESTHDEAADACYLEDSTTNLQNGAAKLPAPATGLDATPLLGQPTPDKHGFQLKIQTGVSFAAENDEEPDLGSMEHVTERDRGTAEVWTDLRLPQVEQRKLSDRALEAHEMSASVAQENLTEESALVASMHYNNLGSCAAQASIHGEAAETCRSHRRTTMDVEHSTTRHCKAEALAPAIEQADQYFELLDFDKSAAAARENLIQEFVPGALRSNIKSGSCEAGGSAHHQASDACRSLRCTKVDVEDSSTKLRSSETEPPAPAIRQDATSQLAQPTLDVEKERGFQLEIDGSTDVVTENAFDNKPNLGSSKHPVERDSATIEVFTNPHSSALLTHRKAGLAAQQNLAEDSAAGAPRGDSQFFDFEKLEGAENQGQNCPSAQVAPRTITDDSESASFEARQSMPTAATNVRRSAMDTENAPTSFGHRDWKTPAPAFPQLGPPTLDEDKKCSVQLGIGRAEPTVHDKKPDLGSSKHAMEFLLEAVVAPFCRRCVRPSCRKPVMSSYKFCSRECAVLRRREVIESYDPRTGLQVQVVAFYYPGREEVWDTLCCSSFLGNFFEAPFVLYVRCSSHRFRNAEAAFQATKFWYRACEFENLTGEQAFAKKRSLRAPDLSYAGFGSNWNAMKAVLSAKFAASSSMAKSLLDTGDAFLLEHNSRNGRDAVWSNDNNGEGSNWLGLLLMLRRDQLRGVGQSRGNSPSWTQYLRKHVDLETGRPLSLQWQDCVRKATYSLLSAMGEEIPRASWRSSPM